MNDEQFERPSYYSIIPATVRYDKRLKAYERLMFSEITALSNKYGYCTAPNSYFASLIGHCSRQCISAFLLIHSEYASQTLDILMP